MSHGKQYAFEIEPNNRGSAGNAENQSAVRSSPKAAPLRSVSSQRPQRFQPLPQRFLGYSQLGLKGADLMLRCLPKTFRLPNSNKDFLAHKFRDALFPKYAYSTCCLPWIERSLMESVEDPKTGVPGLVNAVDARTQFFDLAVLSAVGRGCKQVVILGSETSSIPYRLKLLPDVRFYEVDEPAAIDRKRALVDQLMPDEGLWPRPVFVKADLDSMTLHEALYPTSFSPHAPSVFIMESPLWALSKASAHRRLQGIADLMALGSELVFETVHVDSGRPAGDDPSYGNFERRASELGAPIQAPLDPEDLSALLDQHGLSLTEALLPEHILIKFLPHELQLDTSQGASGLSLGGSKYSTADSLKALSAVRTGKEAVARGQFPWFISFVSAGRRP